MGGGGGGKGYGLKCFIAVGSFYKTKFRSMLE